MRKPYAIVSLRDAVGRIQRQGEVVVFWDIHSKERIFVPDYWKFPKDAVLQLSGKLLAGNLGYLPEDLYICDNSFAWADILTHEEDHQRHERICVEIRRAAAEAQCTP